MINILSVDARNQILKEIVGKENLKRKDEAFTRNEIYQDRLETILINTMKKEYDTDTIKEMRPITSVSLAKRVINELASLYQKSPDREFVLPDGKELTPDAEKQLENIYAAAKVDVKLKKANRLYELHNQSCIYVVPRFGIIDVRVLHPYQYDVIASDDNPEVAAVYILSVHDRSNSISVGPGSQPTYDLNDPPNNMYSSKSQSDGVNQKISDPDDYKKKAMQRFVWWSNENNFITDGNGLIIDPTLDAPAAVVTPELIANPFQGLPFIDIATEKDSEYWVRASATITEFAIEYLQLLMDVFFIHKMQGFAQGIIYSEKPPASMRIGPNRVMHIPLDPNKEVQPRFEFTSPNSNLQASLELLETFMRLFLSSKGIDPKTVSGKLDGQRFSSGVERLLAMLEKFEASADTIALFKWVEDELLDIIIKWNNIMQPATESSYTTQVLDESLRLSLVPEETEVVVNYISPDVIQTKAEHEDSVIKLLDAGLESRAEAIMDLRGVNEDEALRILANIDLQQSGPVMPNPQVPTPPTDTEDVVTNDESTANEIEI